MELHQKKKLFLLPTGGAFLRSKDVSGAGQGSEKERGSLRQKRRGAGRRETDSRIHVRIGDTAEVTKTFFKDDVDRFAALTGDYSRLHTDAEFAKNALRKADGSRCSGGKPDLNGDGHRSFQVRGLSLSKSRCGFGSLFFGDMITAKVTFTACKGTGGRLHRDVFQECVKPGS